MGGTAISGVLVLLFFKRLKWSYPGGGVLIKTVLFDLDGTLLPMDQAVFTKAYFKALLEVMASHRDPDELVKAVWAGTEAMIRNDGKSTNEEVFWKVYTGIFGENAAEDAGRFMYFYENHFAKAKASCAFQPMAAKLVRHCKERGMRLVLASNPLFPMIAQRQRITWAGVDPDDFFYITSYENSSYCKPGIRYYADILERIGALPEECLMIGNDATEDMVASTLGMHVFLLTDCLINEHGVDIRSFPHGDFSRLLEFVEKKCV